MVILLHRSFEQHSHYYDPGRRSFAVAPEYLDGLLSRETALQSATGSLENAHPLNLNSCKEDNLS